MYELQQKESKEKWKIYNSAVDFIQEEDYENAAIQLKDYLANNPHDKPAQYLLDKYSLN